MCFDAPDSGRIDVFTPLGVVVFIHLHYRAFGIKGLGAKSEIFAADNDEDGSYKYDADQIR